jgi:thiol-disulfide isomerase/thioredoxin
METATEPVTPDDIDLGFVAQLVPELDVVTVGGEEIVVGGATRVMVLNPTAALVFRFLDGVVTIGELVDDFADALGADHAVVEADIVAFARELGANGLLEGVALPELEIDWGDWTPPEPLEAGDELDDFTLPDLDGTERSLSDFRGRSVLLVNWSPGCGFCVQIADELTALQPRLAEHDVELVLVTLGDVDANGALFAEHGGVAAPVLLRDGTDVDPFRRTGTPAAYLLDGDGRLVETMVVGSEQVPKLARDLAGVDPATPYGSVEPGIPDGDDDAGHDDGPRGEYLPAPGAMCGPGGGAGPSNRTDWQGTRAYALGGYHVGLSYDVPETAAVLDRLFPGARVNDRRVPDNYSVSLGDGSSSGAGRASRALKLLVRGGSQLVRSRSGARVLAALLQYLSADVAPADPALTRVRATGVLHGDEALLLPAGLVGFVKQVQPRFARAKLQLVDSPRTLVDVDARELVVPEPAVPHDAAVLEEIDADAQLGRELPRARPGRYRLRAWFIARSPERLGRLSPAVAVTDALALVFDLDDDVRAEVERLADFFAEVTAVGVWYENVDELVDQVTGALR